MYKGKVPLLGTKEMASSLQESLFNIQITPSFAMDTPRKHLYATLPLVEENLVYAEIWWSHLTFSEHHLQLSLRFR